MTRAVLYVAHCLAPTPEEIAQHKHRIDGAGMPAQIALRANLEHAMRWLSWLRKSFPETTFIAPWIAAILSGKEDADPVQREMGLVDACATIERCDGIVLCGPRISSGMRREMEHGQMRKKIWIDPADQPDEFQTYDLTGDRVYMPSDVELRTDQTWAEWAKALRV